MTEPLAAKENKSVFLKQWIGEKNWNIHISMWIQTEAAHAGRVWNQLRAKSMASNMWQGENHSGQCSIMDVMPGSIP